jgi:N-alpha-acetyltransferase 15/16, NatA auxiliary subunit
MQAKLQLQRQAFKEAEGIYRNLITLLPDNYEYHQGLCAALSLDSTTSGAPLDEATVSRLRDVYAQLLDEQPDCAAVKRIPLDFLCGADFTAAAKERITHFISRGIPSLFSDLKPLLRDVEKAHLLWTAFEELLQECGSSEGHAVWLHLYLAQHAAELGCISDAIEHIVAAELCEEIGSAALDVFSAKADVLAVAGDAEGAAAAAEVARLLDPKDRYVNSTAAKYWFRAGHLKRARDTALLFAVDIDGNVDNLNEMQVMWYELESGRSHAAAGNLGMVGPLMLGNSKTCKRQGSLKSP